MNSVNTAILRTCTGLLLSLFTAVVTAPMTGILAEDPMDREPFFPYVDLEPLPAEQQALIPDDISALIYDFINAEHIAAMGDTADVPDVSDMFDTSTPERLLDCNVTQAALYADSASGSKVLEYTFKVDPVSVEVDANVYKIIVKVASEEMFQFLENPSFSVTMHRIHVEYIDSLPRFILHRSSSLDYRDAHDLAIKYQGDLKAIEKFIDERRANPNYYQIDYGYKPDENADIYEYPNLIPH